MDDEITQNKRIADLSQEQLGVSQAQFTKVNAQNEALGAVILELAAAQAQAGEIEERAIKREKFYRRRDFIFNQIVAQFQRVSAKKAAIDAENQASRDLIEQEAQADSSLSIAKSNNIIATTMGFMSRDIARLSDFMMGNKLSEEENRREMLAALKDNDGSDFREKFKEKRYQGFFKTLAKIVIGVPLFLVGFFQGYFESLAKSFKLVGGFIDRKVFKGFFSKTGDAIKTSFSNLGTNIKTKVVDFFKRFGKKTGISGALEKIKTFFTSVGRFFKRLIGPRNVKGAINAVKFVIGKVAGFFNTIKTTIAGSDQFKRFIDFAKKAKALGKIFGKLFFPIKVIMGVFSFVKGFMKGYKEGGIIEGIKQGLLNLFDTLVGSVLMLAGNIASFVLKFLGFENAAESIKESFSMVIDGIKGVFSGYVDLVKGIFTLDGALIMKSLGKIWDGIKNILMAGPNYFMGLIKDIFGGDEEGEGGLINKIKSVYERIKEFLAAPLEKIKSFLNKLNPFSKSNEEIQAEIEKEQARIARSKAGEDEYYGTEEKGIAKSARRFRSRKQLAQNGAQMAAEEKQNADMKSKISGKIDSVINNYYQVDNSQTNSSTTFHQENMIDEGLVTVGG